MRAIETINSRGYRSAFIGQDMLTNEFDVCETDGPGGYSERHERFPSLALAEAAARGFCASPGKDYHPPFSAVSKGHVHG